MLAASALDAGARATGADADVGFAWSGRRRWCRRRSELPGHRQRSQIPQHRQWVAQCRALSPDFPAGARGLYPLARGCRIRPAPGMAPALMGCWIEAGAGFFLFSFIAWRRRRATGSIAAGTRGVDLRWGGSMSSLSPDFPAGARGLYPLARGCRIRPAPGMAPALMGCWIEAGAGFFLFSFIACGAVELPGRSRPAPGVSIFGGVAQCRVSLPIFRLALAVFIPWRGAAGFDRRPGSRPTQRGLQRRLAVFLS